MVKQQPGRNYITIVSGLPRSGTSMTMGAMAAGGIEPLVDHVRQADEDNPEGYYEFEPVKRTREDASWLETATGRVVKMVYRLLYELPPDYTYRVIFMQRDLAEVIASQNKMLERSGQAAGAVPDERMKNLFAAELAKCEKWLAGQRHFDVLYVKHRDMINGPMQQMLRIADFLDGGLDVDAMAAVVKPELYRNRRG